jgi:hypothetical protein
MIAAMRPVIVTRVSFPAGAPSCPPHQA